MTKNRTLAVLLICTTITTAMAAIDPTSYTLSQDGKTLMKWTGAETDINFADDDALNGVTEIGAYAFQNSNVVNLILNDGLTTIGAGAFMDASLQSITMPQTLTKLGNAAFSSCTSMTDIELPASVNSIGMSCFYNCSSLASADLSSTQITELPYASFNGCTTLTEISFPAALSTIGEETFNGCYSLVTIALPETVETIGLSAFAGCTQLRDVTFPTGITEIGGLAFESTAIETLDLSGLNALTSIGDEAFGQCDNISTLILPIQEPTIFGKRVFQYCTSLKEVSIPDNYSSVSPQMFRFCTSLEKVTLGKNVTEIGNSAFLDCTSLKEIEWNDAIETISYSAFFECNSLETIELPESVTHIDDWAFNKCANLASVSLGPNVTSIGQEAFSLLPLLTSMRVAAPVPPALGSYVFYNSSIENCTLYVPAESLGTYSETEQWKEFGRINTLSGIESTVTDALSAHSITLIGNTLHVTGLQNGDHVAVYTINGHTRAFLMATAPQWSTDLDKGIYVVAVGKTAMKVAVR